MDDSIISLSALDEFPNETVGQDVLRYICLPEFLGIEQENLLYFIGKRLARMIEFNTLDDVFYIFEKLRWGNLEIVRNRRNRMTFHLMADEVAQRMESSIQIDFRLEAGFLAESVGIIAQRPCEVTEKVNEKLYRAEFHLIFLD